MPELPAQIFGIVSGQLPAPGVEGGILLRRVQGASLGSILEDASGLESDGGFRWRVTCLFGGRCPAWI
jgi:hypothetical protein